MPPLISYTQLYHGAVETLTQAGIGNARQEALWILEDALGITRLQLHANPDTPVDAITCQRAAALFQRRASREPLQYVLGTQEFFGLDLLVRPGVLIPRPDTELLVEKAITLLAADARPVILDVGTGSGCLAISLAVNLPRAVIIASDKSVAALHLARLNAMRHGVSQRILWVAGDLLSHLLSRNLAGKVTAIIANLPYISHQEWDHLSPDVKDFEPRLALDGGPDGLDVYRRLLDESPSLVASEGCILMEVGVGQADLLCRELSVTNALKIVKVWPDSQGIPRVVCVQRQLVETRNS
ncbi:MAG TPA: peptide chain release factor N(5)-glutamine methyltransferase [Nitrospirales bacterium]|nr:peptide chain release factor N(5)-glutamine methyltransferase [Nitrospirales bacterium]